MTGHRRSAAGTGGGCGRLGLTALLALFGLVVAGCGSIRPETLPLDEGIRAFMREEGLPGGVVAARDARGRSMLRVYGLADPTVGRPVEPRTAFRLASLSKPITAAAIQALIDQGALQLDDRLLDLLPLPGPGDARMGQVTVRHLLQHTAGWDRELDFDPLVDAIARRHNLGLGTPADCGPVAFAMLARPLQFDPGSAYAYSNLGYCFLELIVARRTGMPYEAFVQRQVLAPRGVAGLRLGEAGFAAEALARPVGSAVPLPLPAEIIMLGGAGGWVGPAAGMLSFVAAVPPAGVAVPPAFPAEGRPSFYGLGWRIWPALEGPTLSHFGALYGSFTLALRMPDGLAVVALFNARPANDEAAFARLREILPAAMRRALGQEGE